MAETDNPYSSPHSNVDRSLSGGMVACRGCGKDIHSSAGTCPHCGASQRRRGYKNKYVAAILAFFLGGLGIHRFYLGQWWGIFYLLFFWLWIPGIIAFIEMIVFLVCDQVKWDEKYNEGKAAAQGEGGNAAVIAIVLVVLLIGGVAMIGILAAIALPAYQDYTIRSKATEGMVMAQEVQRLVEEYAYTNEQYPNSNNDIEYTARTNSQSVESITVSEGGIITVEYKDSSQQLNDKTVIFEPYVVDGEIDWDCTGGTLESMYRPQMCRE